VYAGNLPGEVEGLEDTKCANCGERLIRRYGYRILDYRLTPEGKCPRCAEWLPGIWAPSFRRQRSDRPIRPVLA